MRRIRSIDGFHALKQRLVSDAGSPVATIIIPAGTCAQASGANALIRVLKRECLDRRLSDTVNLRVTGCHGFCEMEPSLLVEPGRVFYPRISMKDVPRIVEAVVAGSVCEDLLYVDEETGGRIARQDDIPFFRGQTRMLLSRGERCDPIRVHQYLRAGGYSGLVKVLSGWEPEEVVTEVKKSGLRGRGGAGFPTGLKWELLAKQPSRNGKYLVCNADEGDPGAYMDRSLLEGNPHGILEGMLIGAYATGAREGIVYVRDEYPLAIKHLTIALRQAQQLGLL
ncbi:MAG: (2Fe-2S) ferredoxin domain-containing protein, partial [Planctomycetota bacterium]